MSDAFDAARGQADAEGDRELLAELRRLAGAVDPVPTEAVAAARSAIAWRTMDAELALLTADTVAEGLVGVRATHTPVLLAFESDALTVEIEVLEVGVRRRLLGQLAPAGPGHVEVHHRGAVMTVDVDEAGRFTVDDIAPGPVSLRCSVGESVVETDWFLA